MSIRARIGIPLLNGGMPQARFLTWANQFAITKPDRSLGAPFISDRVARNLNVLLCEICWRKYHRWYKRYDYKPNWDVRCRSNCDGCGAKMAACVHFLPEGRFYSTYTEQHGRYPEPNRTIYMPT